MKLALRLRRAARAGTVLLKKLRVPLDDTLLFGGLAAIGTGLWFVYEPAAGIVAGSLLMVLGLLKGRRA